VQQREIEEILFQARVLQTFTSYEVTYLTSSQGKQRQGMKQIPGYPLYPLLSSSKSRTVEFSQYCNFWLPGNTRDTPTLSSLHACLELKENLLCIRTGSDHMEVYVKKKDRESEIFLTSTLNLPRNAAIFKFAEKAISANEKWEIDPHVTAILNSAIFHALNLKVASQENVRCSNHVCIYDL
jgi:hypothetical protein